MPTSHFIAFVRHAQLKKPYDDYTTLPFTEIHRLGTNQIDPSIEASTASEVTKTLEDLGCVSDTLQILHANSTRGVQTAAVVQDYVEKETGVKPKMEGLDSLQEIYFEPDQLMTEAEFLASGLGPIREALFRELSGETTLGAVESIENILHRISSLDERLQELTRDGLDVVCITHGFLMRLLQIYFINGINDPRKITKELLYEMVNYSYGKGFTALLPDQLFREQTLRGGASSKGGADYGE